MHTPLTLHPDRLFPAEPAVRAIARELYQAVSDAPIISPHGHTDPAWFAHNQPFANPAELLITPDHYLFRMLYSQGVSLDELGVYLTDGTSTVHPPREVWRTFATHYDLFRGTPSRLWLNQVFHDVFGLKITLNEQSSDEYFDHISECLQLDAFRPRALFDQFNIEVLATTESAIDDLTNHQIINASDWGGRVITTFRPDAVVDPEHEDFVDNLGQLSGITGENTALWSGYLNALRSRRAFFKATGATATDHGHPTPCTMDLAIADCQKLLDKALKGTMTQTEAEHFRGQLLTEMAGMSLDDGLVMQLHPGSYRNHNQSVFERYGRDKGADIPRPTHYVEHLKPLLDKFGNRSDFTLILFTLDETAYSRELAPLAGHYPCLRLGPAWWFHDSPEGMRRFRQMTTETAGFRNTVGFNDDTRAFLSIPARHDVARRVDAGFLAGLVAQHQLQETEAVDLMMDLSCNLARAAYRL